jgi:hypothetical protein
MDVPLAFGGIPDPRHSGLVKTILPFLLCAIFLTSCATLPDVGDIIYGPLDFRASGAL